MRKLSLISCLWLVVLPGCSQSASPQPAKIIAMEPKVVETLMEKRLMPNFVPGEVVVKMKPAAPGAAALRVMPGTELQRLNLEIRRDQTSGGEIVYRLPPATIGAMQAKDARDRTLEMARNLRARADVEYAQPNYIFQITAAPDDTAYPKQWHYFDNGNAVNQAPGGINLPIVWESNKGSSSVVVAVIDTGILPNHEDIAGSPNLVNGYDMISDAGIGNDGDGRDSNATDPGDAIAVNECYPGSPAQPNSWHGTHVAGTIGVGRTNNNLGIAGINWNVKVQPVRVLGKCGGTMVDINDAIRWAAGLPVPGVPNNPTPAKVINMSLGGASPCSASPATQAAINDAVARGVTVVVAAGNESADASGFLPASCNGVITVAASDRRGYLASRYSNFGPRIDIMAPGGDVRQDSDNNGEPDGVLSMVQGGYAYYNGTSMAAPHVAGVAALLLAQDSGRSPEQIRALLKSSALARTTTECPRPCGAGLLNANASGGSQPPPTSGVDIILAPASINLNVGSSASVSATVRHNGIADPGKTVNFQSSNPGVATVSPASAVTDVNGIATAKVTALDTGSAVLQAESQAVTRTTQITVATRKVPGLPLTLASVLILAALGWFGWRTRRAIVE